ncbi:MAG: DNA polymerase I [Candidatus Riflebacteria bacterium]|nr:DNA polymerase I [Candidatus Riflebacteria bacterium]
MEKCILIDGNNLLYRAYFALKDSLKTKNGISTGALFGFVRTILKILREEKPAYLAIAFDAAKETFRKKIYSDYKATRKPTPPDLLVQMPLAREFAKTLKLRVLENPEYEADDFLGTLSEVFSKQVEIEILTGDRDLLQLIEENVKVNLCVKGVSELKTFDVNSFTEEYGFSPLGIVELKALWGDSSDNIPGVDGIGEKKAMALIQEFGSIEKIYQSLEKIPNKRLREQLESGRESAELSRKLAEIYRKVPIDLTLEDLKWTGFEGSLPQLVPFLRKFEFSSILAEFEKDFGNLPPAEEEVEQLALKSAPGERLLICSLSDLEARFAMTGDHISIDLETTGLDPCSDKIVGFSFACSRDWAAYVPLRHSYLGIEPGEQINPKIAFEALKKALVGKTIIGHNLKFDLSFLAREGVTHPGPFYDTMLAAYVLDPMRSNALKNLAREILKLETIDFSQVATKADFSMVYLDKAAEYGGQDAILPLLLKPIFDAELTQRKLSSLLFDIELPLLNILFEMEMTGIKINTSYLNELSREFGNRLHEIEKAVHSAVGFNFNLSSPKQLQEVLFTKLGLKPPKKTKTGFSTDAEVLRQLAKDNPVCSDLLEHREISKLKSTYADSLIELAEKGDGLVHTNFNQNVTATGRLSSSNPNLQNIPIKSELGRKIRRAFEPPFENHLFLSLDYSQIELRLLAHFSKDPSLIEAFKNSWDIHSLTASRIFKKKIEEVSELERKIGKTVNFGIIYGISAHALSEDLGISRISAQNYIDEFFSQFPGVTTFFEENLKRARESGGVETLFGRPRPIPELREKNKQVQAAGERVARNSPLQGSAADLVKKAMIDSRKVLLEKGLKTRLILQIHDELVFSTPKNELSEVKTLMKSVMENVVSLEVPLVCDASAGENLADLHEI